LLCLPFIAATSGDDALSQVVNAAINFRPLFNLVRSRQLLLGFGTAANVQ